jgi:hypothetical protein
VNLSGGPDEYFTALRSQATYVRDAYSVASQGLPALLANFSATTYAMGWGLLAIAPLAFAAATAAALRAWRVRATDDTTFLLIWSLPALGLYVVLHIGDWGYVLSALPAVYVLGARALATVIASAGSFRRAALAVAALGFVAGPALLFVLSTSAFSAAAIAAHDRELSARVSYVRENFAPRATMILTREDFLLVRYYLPEYRSRQHDPEPFAHSSRRMRASKVERIVVFTRGLVPDRPVDVRRVQCSKGIELVYLDVVPGAVLEFRGERYTVATN